VGLRSGRISQIHCLRWQPSLHVNGQYSLKRRRWQRGPCDQCVVTGKALAGGRKWVLDGTVHILYNHSKLPRVRRRQRATQRRGRHTQAFQAAGSLTTSS
jgi:hypothetical protein